MGNAVYRDLIQASVMVGVEHLCIAVPNAYKYRSGKRTAISHDYDNARDLAEAVYGHSRMRLPYRLIVIGYRTPIETPAATRDASSSHTPRCSNSAALGLPLFLPPMSSDRSR